MPDDELVVSDTSPLLNLALIDQLGPVREQFSTVSRFDKYHSQKRRETSTFQYNESSRIF